MQPLTELTRDLPIVVTRDVVIEEGIENEPPIVVKANSRGVIPAITRNTSSYYSTNVCPVIVKSDDDFLGISQLVFLPWDAIEPLH